jgi:hypothetical protein
MPASVTKSALAPNSISALPEPDAGTANRSARAKRTPDVARRAADRRSAAVVAEEIRRLGSYWRPDGLRTGNPRRRGGQNPRPKAAF